jgi:hypothetical protein
MSIAQIHRNTLAWLEANPHDYDTLTTGPLGEALTRAELHGLANNPDSMARFIEDVRALASTPDVAPPVFVPEWQGSDAALAWNTCPLHGHYVARPDADGPLIDCPACTNAHHPGHEEGAT